MNEICEMLIGKCLYSVRSQSEDWIVDALGCDIDTAIEWARAGRITCVTMQGQEGETYHIDGKPFLWVGPIKYEENRDLPDHVHKMVLTRQMRKLP